MTFNQSNSNIGQLIISKILRNVKNFLISMFFLTGNTLYSCNNWAGGLSAIYSLPGAQNTAGLRIGACFGYGAIVFGVLIADKGDSLGIGLGMVMVAMVILFLVVVIKLGMD